MGASVLNDPEGPVFALIGDPDDATIAWKLKRRRGGQAAVAFLLGTRGVTRDRLSKAGWECVDIYPDMHPSDAWRAAGHHAGVVA